jgi:hypothetical protein
VGQSLNPYLSHYKIAFAFSGLLYPLFYQLTLRLAFPNQGEHRAYPVDGQGETTQGGWRPYPGGGYGVAVSSTL